MLTSEPSFEDPEVSCLFNINARLLCLMQELNPAD